MPFLGLSSWLEPFRPWVMARLVPAFLADHPPVGFDRTGLCIARVDEILPVNHPNPPDPFDWVSTFGDDAGSRLCAVILLAVVVAVIRVSEYVLAVISTLPPSFTADSLSRSYYCQER